MNELLLGVDSLIEQFRLLVYEKAKLEMDIMTYVSDINTDKPLESTLEDYEDVSDEMAYLTELIALKVKGAVIGSKDSQEFRNELNKKLNELEYYKKPCSPLWERGG